MDEQAAQAEGAPEYSQAQAQREALARMIIEDYEAQQFDAMGNLHNRFVGFIAEAGLPLRNVTIVLEILLRECLAQIEQAYLKE